MIHQVSESLGHNGATNFHHFGFFLISSDSVAKVFRARISFYGGTASEREEEEVLQFAV
jgi:hypothetical protein